jgi:hypothetical protein
MKVIIKKGPRFEESKKKTQSLLRKIVEDKMKQKDKPDSKE